MVIVIILILLSVCLFLGYCIYSTFSESNFDIVNNIRYDKKGFFGSLAVIIICLVGIYFCCITPTSFIRNEYVHKNGTMTVVEYSLTGDSTINTNVKLPKTTYGTVKEVKSIQYLMVRYGIIILMLLFTLMMVEYFIRDLVVRECLLKKEMECHCQKNSILIMKWNLHLINIYGRSWINLIRNTVRCVFY